MIANALSLAARALRARLAAYLALPEGQILIGNPATAAELISGQGGKQFLNLFFYRVELSGHPADATSDDPTYVRVECLITAFGNDEGAAAERVTAGENDLRLIGSVVACLHEAPVLALSNPDNGASVALQVVPTPLGVETINNLWATQVNTSYRPSVTYELSIAPMPFETKVARAQLVGEVVLDVQAHAGDRPLPSEVPSPDWIPELRFAAGDGLHQVLSFDVSERPPALSVVVAGRVGAAVKLRWRMWTAAHGWRVESEHDAIIESATLPGAPARELPLPAAGSAPQQLTLAAVYQWQHHTNSPAVEVTSNLLLVSVHAGGGA